ncbi:hypothetical protein Pst134EA_002612 [Puccinia striiformis f. sp. tritici]|uniref:hypothetical protein n=1 Tax=Puccinia striiformis f. sp. tritici TaxID=168172 RepID=UPI002008105B|nr:hypothetical protein Pst134EA_002612 [Puccinia striiformis f. sp. tritici]KAH9464201.1 hypothetical protein Pst134EB_003733 [Puccinia striiformis f. sp. tritici]KAH9471984.1 hypothetical protein Pst134EA_002612 [Puccinia striiformis f. sp. tritici]
MASFFNNTNKKVPNSSINWSLLAGAESINPSSSSDSSTYSTTTPKTLSDHETASSDQSSPPPSSPLLSLSMNKTSQPISKAQPWMPKMVGLSQDPNDWLWQMTEEPHRSRRRAILKDHPEVHKLMGYTWTTKWVVLFVVSVQLSIAVYFGLRSEQQVQSAWSWRFFLTAYMIGGTANQNLFLAIHEITHNLAFKKILHNKLMFLAKLFLRNTFQILFYALRPGFVRSQKVTGWVLGGFALQLGFDFLLYKYFGLAAVMYLIMSSFFAGSLHPCAAHFIAEHYVWNDDGGEQETWSYYGPLNILAYNVGYHNEHHDFPSIPWTRLPELKAMASEYYDPLPQHSSWPLVIVKFIFDNRVGLFSRVKRLPLGPHLPIVPYKNLSKHEDRKNI